MADKTTTSAPEPAAAPRAAAAPVAYPQSVMSAEVRDAYDLVGWTGGHRQEFGKKFGIVDLSTLTPALAAKLISKGFTKLKAKSAPAQ